MVSTNPHLLPVSTTTAAVEMESRPPPSGRAFVNRVTETVRDGLSRSRPWLELLDRSAFSKPDSHSKAATRFRKNSSYFRVNYVCVVSLILGFSLLAHPFSLVLLLCVAASWLFLYIFRPSDRPLILLGRSFSDHETLGSLIISTIALIFFTSVASVLLSVLMIGVATVCVHGAFRVPDDLFLDKILQPSDSSHTLVSQRPPPPPPRLLPSNKCPLVEIVDNVILCDHMPLLT